MNTFYTPGPWVADTDVGVVGYEESNGDIFVIADIYARPGFSNEKAANANLIAAAPLLLAELLKLTEYAERNGALCISARSIISLATGDVV